MVSCKSCQRCINLNKIYICMKGKIEVKPVPNLVCEYFEKRKYKMPKMVVNDDCLYAHTTVDRPIEKDDQTIHREK